MWGALGGSRESSGQKQDRAGDQALLKAAQPKDREVTEDQGCKRVRRQGLVMSGLLERGQPASRLQREAQPAGPQAATCPPFSVVGWSRHSGIKGLLLKRRL